MSTTSDIGAKLWSLCHLLRDDGVTYHQYVNELTWLLFLKMADELPPNPKKPEGLLPEGWRWTDLKGHTGLGQLNFYREQLLHLGTQTTGTVQAIYANANSSLRQPKVLADLVAELDRLDWYDAREEGLGDLYEDLLQRNASEVKSGAGQYFTPRVLIDSMVALVKPQAGEVISDPAAGTLGFITSADAHIRAATKNYQLLSVPMQDFQRERAYYAVELVPDTQRLALMNALLHDVTCEIHLGNTLASMGSDLPASDVILSNPPFGSKKGAGAVEGRVDLPHPTNNKQLAFLQHIYRNLKPGGRAAVVLPDNVLFEDGVGQKVRTGLMDECNLHTILRLPTGIFYAQGVKTNVLFFTKGSVDAKGKPKDTGNTKAVWVYDLRTNLPAFGKRTPFTRAHLADFEAAYGTDPHGASPRTDTGETGRFRKFDRAEIKARGDNLDISWLRDESQGRAEDLPEPEAIAAEILGHLQTATEEIQALLELLGGSEVEA